jgi:glutamine---fructose-6-phosphate transaminase (isomerizing)
MIERLARIPVEVDYGSEYRYRDPIMGPDTLTVVISQSGETADTLAAQRESKAKGSKTLAICNVVGSMMTREASGTIHDARGSGDRRGVHQGVHLADHGAVHSGDAPGPDARHAERRGVEEADAGGVQLPGMLERMLANDSVYPELVKKLHRATDFLYLGRGIHFPMALEGALKLKEISYIHAEGYPAGEMKHGPNALIDENLPVVVIATYDPERRRRKHPLREDAFEHSGSEGAFGYRGDRHCQRRRRRWWPEVADHMIYVPASPTNSCCRSSRLCLCSCWPITLPSACGCDVDQPRNLAKSVTVE